MIYADHAATTKISPVAKEAMIACMDECWGNPSSLHTSGQLAAEALQAARERIAACIGASPKEIYFTGGGSEADNQAIRSAAFWGQKRGKKHIISTTIEHHAVLHTLDRLKEHGFDITLIPVGPEGIVKVEDVAAAIREDTALVTIMFANNEIGSIQPIREIGALCREKKVVFHTDAVQAVGHLPIDVKEDNIDMMSFAGPKFNGPRGVGALSVRQRIPLRALIEGGAQEGGKRGGTENLPAIVGMAAALEDACAQMDVHNTYVTGLRDHLIAGLSEIPHSALNGDPIKRLPGNVSFCFEGIEGESLLLMLDMRGIMASSGSACTSGSLDPSHVLLAIGRPHEVAHGSLRLSIGHDNTMEEMDQMINDVKEVVDYLRNMSPVWKELERGERDYVIQ